MLLALVLVPESVLGCAACMYVLPWRDTCITREDDVPCTSWWCQKRHSGATVFAGLSGFKLAKGPNELRFGVCGRVGWW